MYLDAYLDHGTWKAETHLSERGLAVVRVKTEEGEIRMSGRRTDWERLRGACEAALMEISLAEAQGAA